MNLRKLRLFLVCKEKLQKVVFKAGTSTFR